MEKKEASETASSSNETGNSSLVASGMAGRSLPTKNTAKPPNNVNAFNPIPKQQSPPKRTVSALPSNSLDAKRRTGQHLLSTAGMPASTNRQPPQSQSPQSQNNPHLPNGGGHSAHSAHLHYQQQQRQVAPSLPNFHAPQHLQQAVNLSPPRSHHHNLASFQKGAAIAAAVAMAQANRSKQSGNSNTGNDRVTVEKTQKPLVMPSSSAQKAAEEAVLRRIRALPPGHTSRLGGKLTYQPRPAHMPMPKPAVPSKKATTTPGNTTAAVASGAKLQNLKKTAEAGRAAARLQKTGAGTATGKKFPQTNSKPTAAAAAPANSQSPATTTKSTIPTPSSQAIPATATAAQQPPVLDEAQIIDEAIRYAREPLTDKYAPFIIPSDKTLFEARNRLIRAIEQTRQLRAAFSERVYGKYRVCLTPPPMEDQILACIQNDPAATQQELLKEISSLKSEKEIEKREAHKLNAEISAANEASAESKSITAAAVNAETAEQLMFISAGLSLIILPEQNVSETIDMSRYPDRAPINPETGQRVRSISVAAAAAGEVMLDRARKGAAMKMERERRKQLQIMAGEDPEKEAADNSYSRLSLLTSTNTLNSSMASTSVATANKALLPSKIVVAKATAAATAAVTPAAAATATYLHSTFHHHHSLTPKSFKKVAPQKKSNPTLPIISAKAIRARVQATMSNNTLLSLNPTAEELRTDGKCGASATLLMELGVGGRQQQHQQHQQQQQGLKHPFPTSIGARRQNSPGVVGLPPIPSPKERKVHRPQTVLPEVKSERASKAIQGVLQQYLVGGQPPRKRRRTDISFLYGLEYPSPPSAEEAESTEETNGPSEENNAKETNPSIDPMLTFNVLRAVGLIQPSCDSWEKEPLSPVSIIDSSLIHFSEQHANAEYHNHSRSSVSKLKKLSKKLTNAGRENQKTVVSIFFPKVEDDTLKKKKDAAKKSLDNEMGPMEIDSNDQSVDDTKEAPKTPPTVAIRGGGSELPGTAETKAPPVAGGTINGKDSNIPEKVKLQNARPMNMPPQAGTALHAKELATQQQRITMMNQQLVHRMGNTGHPNVLAQNGKAGATRNNRIPGLPADGFRSPGTAAMQMAHQFRHASASMQRMQGHPTGDLEAYIGNLHAQQQGGYEWSQIAALGLNTHRAIVNFSAQDRARVIIAEQQNAAAAAAAQVAAAQRQQAVVLMGAGAFGGAPRFSHLSGRTAALINSSALMGQHGMSAGVAQSAQMQQNKKKERKSTGDPNKARERSNSESKNLKEDKSHSNKKDEPAKKRKLSTASNESSHSDKRRNVSSASSTGSNSKRLDASDSMTSKTVNGTKEAQKKATKPRPQPKGVPRSTNVVKNNQKKISTAVLTKDPKKGLKIVAGRPEVPKVLNKSPRSAALQFYVPPAPAGIPSDMASLMLASKVHCVIDAWETGKVVFDATTIIDFLLSVGISVPIPKALVVNPLKERIGSTATKNNHFANIPASSREVVVALILLWLWKHHEDSFQKAFAKSGRIDVDPECKWLINATVDRSVSVLGKEITSAGTPLNASLSLSKKGGGSSQKAVGQANNVEEEQERVTRVDLLCASIVSKSLLEGTAIDNTMDYFIPNFYDMLEYLDECRKGALHSKAQERALLAALISRKATMSLPFSHAYASSMVRSGEAIGHAELFEIVQNENVKVSTMIPYDVFTDESGAWEDPCRPKGAFTAGLTGDDLMRRAHARAMIQKSLKKLQDRHSIKGGTPNSGPYTDPPNFTSNADSGKSSLGSPGISGRGWGKRRPSFSEPKIQPGTGSAQATSISLYEPKHYSRPVEWNSAAPENLPYGKFSTTKANGGANRRLVVQDRSNGRSKVQNGKKDGRSQSVGALTEADVPPSKSGYARSTHEISWSDIANVFENQSVQLTVKKKKKEVDHHQASISKDKIIYAPFVQKTDEVPSYNESESESDTEEDLSNGMVLSRHQEVLDKMKEKLSDFLDARKKSVERKKKRDSLKKASN